MPIDFFNNECHQEITANRFGLCDDLDLPGDPLAPAYAKPYEEEDWIITVQNNNNIPVTFTAIDHCVVADDGDDPRPQACDCMLSYTDILIFIELKDRLSRGWQEIGLSQLSSTVNLFKELHNLDAFNIKKAYLSNKARPEFPYFNGTDKNRFEDNTGFDLLTETIISIN